jgi:hypothetical protein
MKKPSPVTTTSSRLVWSCPWYGVRQDEIILPDGGTAVYTATTIPATYTPRHTPTPIISTCTCTSNIYNCADFDTQACYDRCFPTAGDIHFLDSNEDGKVCVMLP